MDFLITFLTRGGILMIPIGLCSLAALAVFVDRFLFLRRALDDLKILKQRIAPAFSLNNPPDEAARLCRKEENFLSVSLRGLICEPSAHDHIISRLSGAFEKRMTVLATTSHVAPLLGLLGTVFGMIKTFQKLESMPEVASQTMIAGGIWEALITTAAGLSVAIPSYIAYQYLATRSNEIISEVESLNVELSRAEKS